ncbi:hypothetical protein [Streptomyces sp. VRA16 Mangrove soil]|uniref:hypothetical protein n=1 Tax=Streptomyces sp. VRA16 Mangrove soil TaxID=2817434 RepID=UPI001A9F0652|nr:hypothetical protein [Streptomyces sp. VRA16 Mangrove soil]MBO1337003.1 hypothetical protein [Streptomyces sp. VRA16 Mangrove soil]
MSLHDDLAAATRCLEDLTRAVGRLEPQLGTGPDLRRVRADTDHLRESLALLRESAAQAPPRRPDLVSIPDTPYDRSLWTDSDDEGLGARDRHAP